MFKIICRSYKMSISSRLDRLSALLEALAPRVELIGDECPVDTGTVVPRSSAAPFLQLYLLTQGELVLTQSSQVRHIPSPSIVICRSDLSHRVSVVGKENSGHLVRAKVAIEGPAGALLFNEFSEPVILSLAQTDTALSQAVALISSELAAPRCGQPALLNRAGDILFIGLLRHLVAHPATGSGLFNGLADPRIARALVALHSAPQEAWTLERMAAEAGMSRTAFANTFRDVMNQTPGKYLGILRLAIARSAVDSGRGLKRAAKESGYASSSALSRALSRAMEEEVASSSA